MDCRFNTQHKNGFQITLVSVLFLVLISCATTAPSHSSAWGETTAILSRIKVPIFPAKEFSIAAYGAKGDGTLDCSSAFAKAIQSCTKNGGGTVIVPAGNFLTGPIHLEDNVNLHLEDGATIQFLQDSKKYLPLVFSRWEGVECMNYSSMIYAFGKVNIAITGKGVLDGQANPIQWWSWKGTKEHGWREGMPTQKKGRDSLFAMGQQGIPVEKRIMGEGSFLRPNFIQLYKCKNILIDGVTIINSPMWEIHPVLSENITIQNVTIDTHGPNNDGIDPESCKDVLIRNCFFNTGDDCIAIKSGRNNDGRRVNMPSENIIIQRCVFKDGHGAVTIGSEISGGARNVFAEDCEVESPVLYNALRIKTNAVRGGTIENVYIRNFNVKLVDRAVVDVDLFYEEGKNGNYLPTVRNIGVDGLVVEQCKVAFNLVGYENAPLHNISFSKCDFRVATQGYNVEQVEGIEFSNTKVNGTEIHPK
jgi:polygalacturonase